MDDHDVPTKSLASQWWRWPLLPFASFLGGAIGASLLTLFMWFGMKMSGGYTEDGWYYRYIMPLFSAGAFGYLTAIIAAYVAPKGKLIAGTVIVTILGIVVLIGAVLYWLLDKYSLGESIQATVGAIATMIGSVAALIQVHDENR